jgi:hypothetical protein
VLDCFFITLYELSDKSLGLCSRFWLHAVSRDESAERGLDHDCKLASRGSQWWYGLLINVEISIAPILQAVTPVSRAIQKSAVLAVATRRGVDWV